jgi:hypothetical protein
VPGFPYPDDWSALLIDRLPEIVSEIENAGHVVGIDMADNEQIDERGIKPAFIEHLEHCRKGRSVDARGSSVHHHDSSRIAEHEQRIASLCPDRS